MQKTSIRFFEDIPVRAVWVREFQMVVLRCGYRGGADKKQEPASVLGNGKKKKRRVVCKL